MADYKLKYKGAEIDDRLTQIDTLSSDISDLNQKVLVEHEDILNEHSGLITELAQKQTEYDATLTTINDVLTSPVRGNIADYRSVIANIEANTDNGYVTQRVRILVKDLGTINVNFTLFAASNGQPNNDKSYGVIGSKEIEEGTYWEDFFSDPTWKNREFSKDSKGNMLYGGKPIYYMDNGTRKQAKSNEEIFETHYFNVVEFTITGTNLSAVDKTHYAWVGTTWESYIINNLNSYYSFSVCKYGAAGIDKRDNSVNPEVYFVNENGKYAVLNKEIAGGTYTSTVSVNLDGQDTVTATLIYMSTVINTIIMLEGALWAHVSYSGYFTPNMQIVQIYSQSEYNKTVRFKYYGNEFAIISPTTKYGDEVKTGNYRYES